MNRPKGTRRNLVFYAVGSTAGQRFRLKSQTIATASAPNGDGISLFIPRNSTIVVIDEIPSDWHREPNRQVKVRWNGDTLSVFLADIFERGERFSDC